jgi:hypothetical protein
MLWAYTSAPPYNRQTVGTSFTFKAAGNAFDGIAKRMELWIDGKKFGQRLEDQFKKTVTDAEHHDLRDQYQD